MNNPCIASILLEEGLDRPLSYLVSDEMIPCIKRGMLVEVPVKNGKRKGYVLSVSHEKTSWKLKSISKILSNEILSPDLFELGLWMAKYYASPLYKIFSCMIPSSVRQSISVKKSLFLTLQKSPEELLALQPSLQKYKEQCQVIAFFLKNPKGIFLHELLDILPISRSPIDALIKKRILLAHKTSEDLLLEGDYFPTSPKILTEEQKNSLTPILQNIEKNQFSPHLIYGVTGSGKTEIYLQAIQKALDEQKSSIMLVPEIALTAQTIERFRSRFPNHKIAVLHHKRSQGERSEAWNLIQKGEAKIVIGARSAIFSPMKNLGLIIVDEEHDSSYKQQDDMPTYHARNIAVMRGKINQCTVVLGSATPSLESYKNGETGKYVLSTLKERANESHLPKVHIVNMKECWEKGLSHFSDVLLDKIKDRLAKGEQTLLFLNRRGYHTSLVCKECSHIIKCPHCDIALTYHKQRNILSCHLCSFELLPPKECPACHGSEYLAFKGYGTELIEKALHAIFPEIRTLRADRDTTQKKESHEKLFQEFRAGKADILIGTQMIVKGLHFPSVTLVGVIQADTPLHIPDFRSSEYAFQLLTQVAGRSGRSEIPGEVVIQTLLPEHPIIQLSAKQDYVSFYQREITEREAFSYPPFSQMIKISFSGISQEQTKEEGNRFRKELLLHLPSTCEVHPLTASGHAKVQDHYRFFFLLKGKSIFPMTEAIEKTRQLISLPKKVRLFIDVDPLSTFF